MQQYRLLPLVAASYVLHWTGVVMDREYASMKETVSRGDFSTLPRLHANSSGLKSLTTRLVSDGLEECRKACGGHGYMAASGLPEFLNTYLANCTLEGDNYLIAQQCTRCDHRFHAWGCEGKRGEVAWGGTNPHKVPPQGASEPTQGTSSRCWPRWVQGKSPRAGSVTSLGRLPSRGARVASLL